MQLFYHPTILEEDFVLNKEESRHCVKVLRKRVGDRLHIIDGKGGFYQVQLVETALKKCRFIILEKEENYQALPYGIHIAIAPTKNMTRFEWFLEKATEIGISSITPIICARSERKTLKIERAERILIAAMKQSIKAFLPQLHPPIAFQAFLEIWAEKAAQKSVAFVAEKSQHLKDLPLQAENLVLIGPEGDFTPAEIENAQTTGFKMVSLGPHRLRTETAGVVACHLLNLG